MTKVMKDNNTSQVNPNKLKCLALENRHLQQDGMLRTLYRTLKSFHHILTYGIIRYWIMQRSD
jgi:hypothetical protein